MADIYMIDYEILKYHEQPDIIVNYNLSNCTTMC